MRQSLTGLLALGLLTLAAQAGVRADEKAPAKSPAFQALKKEFDEAQEKYAAELKTLREEIQKKMQEATTQEEKLALQKEFQEKAGKLISPAPKFAPRFLGFAEKNPQDPSAFDALFLALQTSGGPYAKGETYGKALHHLQAEYATRPEIVKVVRRVAGAVDMRTEKFVQEVRAKNTDRKVQALALKTLAGLRKNAADLGEQAEQNQQLRARLEKVLGKDQAEKLTENAEKNRAEAKDLAKELRAKFGDLYPDLAVGKAVPEAVSQDVNGKEVRLSSLRGKVVVLDFWATWCGPCRAMIPHEREMVEKLKDKPFVLVSISADEKKKTLTDFLAKEKMPWTHWWNGAEGGLVEAWDIGHFPTIYVLDAKGVIRYTEIRGRKLEEAVNELLGEMKKAE
jgi:thiol-disulfide isomerase/thioredoxin